MTTAERNNERATVEEFDEKLGALIDEAREAGLDWHHIEQTLTRRQFQAETEALKETDQILEAHGWYAKELR
jgi:hypothetical protein